MNVIQRKSRLEAKVNPDIYQLLKQAALISGRTLTDFVISVAYEEAKKTIAEHQVLYLSLKEQKLLIENLSKSHTPNESMQEALNMHRLFLETQRTKNEI